RRTARQRPRRAPGSVATKETRRVAPKRPRDNAAWGRIVRPLNAAMRPIHKETARQREAKSGGTGRDRGRLARMPAKWIKTWGRRSAPAAPRHRRSMGFALLNPSLD